MNKNTLASSIKRRWHRAMRRAFAFLPKAMRFGVYRSFVDCDPAPDQRLVLKIAETQEELEACFKLLHDAYVSSGFMQKDPSGMRATIYHALPTTTTLCAKYDGEVVGTLSLIRESVFGFPLQSIFDLQEVRAKGGQIAEASALAVHPKFRKTGGIILFPMMKYMYEYCRNYFDTRHLVIAVNPDRIELYESLLLFQRLTKSEVDNYDFANGAPAVGACLDLQTAPDNFEDVYGEKTLRRNLYNYFVHTKMHNIVMPTRRYFTTNDPVMTPELLDYFFNQRTQGFSKLDERSKILLHTIYNLPDYQEILPPIIQSPDNDKTLRQHERFSVKCPASFVVSSAGASESFELQVVDLSQTGFLAQSSTTLPVLTAGTAVIVLGNAELSTVKATAVRAKHDDETHHYYSFTLVEPDLAWRKFISALMHGSTHEDLTYATRFLLDEEAGQ